MMLRMLQWGRHLLARWILALAAVAIGGAIIDILRK